MEIWFVAFENMAEGKLETKNKLYWKMERGASDERENINFNSLG